MRAVLIAWALMLSLPAAAQDVDASTIKVLRDGNVSASCGFAAVPGLRMQEVGGKPFIATFSATAQGSVSERTRLNLLFMSASEESVQPIATVASIWIELSEGSAPLASARVRFDGVETSAKLEIETSEAPRWFTINPDNDSFVAYFDAVLGANMLEAELLDASGKTIGRHRWDVSRTRLIPDLLRKSNWRCTGGGS